MKIWSISDTHFGHANILLFKDDNGELIRGKLWDKIYKHDQALIDNWNSVVTPQDHVYHLGDVVINKAYLKLIPLLNGHKRLVLGNHDIYPVEMYLEAGFKKIYAYRVWPKLGIIMSHIPLHPMSMRQRKWVNWHGHMHHNVMSGPDAELYRNVSCEQINYTPTLVME